MLVAGASTLLSPLSPCSPAMAALYANYRQAYFVRGRADMAYKALRLRTRDAAWREWAKQARLTSKRAKDLLAFMRR